MTNMVSQKKVFWASRSVKDCLNSDENGRPGTDQPENQTDLKTTSNKSKTISIGENRQKIWRQDPKLMIRKKNSLFYTQVHTCRRDHHDCHYYDPKISSFLHFCTDE